MMSPSGLGPAGTGKTYLAMAMAGIGAKGEQGRANHPHTSSGGSRGGAGIFAW